MRIIAVDPGFDRLGVAVLESKGNAVTLCHSGCITTRQEDELATRLRVIGDEVRRLIKTHKPEALAIEALFFNTNQKTALSVAAARGVVLYGAAENGLPVFEYTPGAVKVAVTGYGHAPKNQVAAMVKRLVAIDAPEQKLDDEFDAIAVGLTHLAHQKGLAS